MVRWYVDSNSPVVGIVHTWTTTATTTSPVIFVLAWSGSGATPKDQTAGTFSNWGSTAQPGSVTPTQDNEVLISGYCNDSNSGQVGTIDSSFTIGDTVAFLGSAHFGAGSAYKIQTTAGAENPTWSLSGGQLTGILIGTFKAAAAAAPGASVLLPWATPPKKPWMTFSR